MKLYAKGYDPKKGPAHKDNREHYVVVDSGSAAEASFKGQGFSANPEHDAAADAQAAEAGDTSLADATAAAEQKLQREHAQRVAAEAKAIKGGVIPATPNDQSRQTPNTESADGKVIKDSVGEQPVGEQSAAAVEATVAGTDTKTTDAKAADAKTADAKTAEAKK